MEGSLTYDAALAAMIDGLSDETVIDILKTSRSIAVVGASPKEDRASYVVMKFLIDRGYKVYPINPGLAGSEILGRTVYASLAEVPAPIDIVDIFRNSEAAASVVEDALSERDRLELKVVWMQLGVVNVAAASAAEAAGLTVVMDRCPKIEIGRLF